MRVARRAASTCSRRCPASTPTRCCSRPTSRRARIRIGAVAGREASRSTTCTRCASGRSCSRDGECWCASIPGTGAGTTITCARPAPTPSSACRCSRSTNWSALAKSVRRRRLGLHAHTGSGIFDVRNWTKTAVGPRRGGGAGSRHHHAEHRWRPRGAGSRPAHGVDLAALDAAGAGAQGEASRASSCGSSRAGTWWRTAGVLLARVTQLKDKGDQGYVGRRHRHEFADPAGAVRRLPRDREPHALGEPKPELSTSWGRSARAATCSGTTGCCR